jgi:hypothetical protein
MNQIYILTVEFLSGWTTISVPGCETMRGLVTVV